MYTKKKVTQVKLNGRKKKKKRKGEFEKRLSQPENLQVVENERQTKTKACIELKCYAYERMNEQKTCICVC